MMKKRLIIVGILLLIALLANGIVNSQSEGGLFVQKTDAPLKVKEYAYIPLMKANNEEEDSIKDVGYIFKNYNINKKSIKDYFLKNGIYDSRLRIFDDEFYEIYSNVEKMLLSNRESYMKKTYVLFPDIDLKTVQSLNSLNINDVRILDKYYFVQKEEYYERGVLSLDIEYCYKNGEIRTYRQKKYFGDVTQTHTYKYLDKSNDTYILEVSDESHSGELTQLKSISTYYKYNPEKDAILIESRAYHRGELIRRIIYAGNPCEAYRYEVLELSLEKPLLVKEYYNSELFRTSMHPDYGHYLLSQDNASVEYQAQIYNQIGNYYYFGFPETAFANQDTNQTRYQAKRNSMYRKAIQYYTQSTTLNPLCLPDFFNKALALIRLKDFDSAIEALKDLSPLIERDDCNTYLLLLLDYYKAVSFYGRGDYIQAVKLFTRLVSVIGDELINRNSNDTLESLWFEYYLMYCDALNNISSIYYASNNDMYRDILVYLDLVRQSLSNKKDSRSIKDYSNETLLSDKVYSRNIDTYIYISPSNSSVIDKPEININYIDVELYKLIGQSYTNDNLNFNVRKYRKTVDIALINFDEGSFERNNAIDRCIEFIDSITFKGEAMLINGYSSQKEYYNLKAENLDKKRADFVEWLIKESVDELPDLFTFGRSRFAPSDEGRQYHSDKDRQKVEIVIEYNFDTVFDILTKALIVKLQALIK